MVTSLSINNTNNDTTDNNINQIESELKVEHKYDGMESNTFNETTDTIENNLKHINDTYHPILLVHCYDYIHCQYQKKKLI